MPPWPARARVAPYRSPAAHSVLPYLPPHWLSSIVSCLSAASFVSPIHLLHASLILINMWISGYTGLGRRGLEKRLLGCCCHGASSILLLLLLLLAPTGLPVHRLVLPGP